MLSWTYGSWSIGEIWRPVDHLTGIGRVGLSGLLGWAWANVLVRPWRDVADTGKSTCPCHPSPTFRHRLAVSSGRAAVFWMTEHLRAAFTLLIRPIPCPALSAGYKSFSKTRADHNVLPKRPIQGKVPSRFRFRARA